MIATFHTYISFNPDLGTPFLYYRDRSMIEIRKDFWEWLSIIFYKVKEPRLKQVLEPSVPVEGDQDYG